MEINDTATATTQPGLPDPGQVPASPAASSEPAPQGSINQPAPRQYTEAEVQNLTKGMNQAQREAAELKKRLRDVEPIVDEYARNPQFREHINSYNQVAENQISPEVTRILDPLYQEVVKTRDEVASWKFGQQMEALAKEYPDVMTAEAKERLATDAYATGNYDLEYHFLKNYGKQMIEQSRKQATQAAVQTIQHNNQLYASGTGPSGAIAPPVDFSRMTSEQKQAHVEKEIDRIWNDPDYAAKVAAQLG